MLDVSQGDWCAKGQLEFSAGAYNARLVPYGKNTAAHTLLQTLARRCLGKHLLQRKALDFFFPGRSLRMLWPQTH